MTQEGPWIRCLAAVAGCGITLRASAANPSRAVAEARAALLANSGAEPFAALVPAVALVAWALVAWLSAIVLLTVASELPGTAGRCAAVVTRRIAPAAVRRSVQLALGIGLAAGVTCASPAVAAPLAEGSGTSAVAMSVPSLDWVTGARPTAPSAAPATPAAAPAPASAAPFAAAPAPAAPAPPTAPATVVVAPGDSLWSLAERSLGHGATAQQVAATWPAWWAANRDVLGPDPHVIHPGDRLTPPTTSS